MPIPKTSLPEARRLLKSLRPYTGRMVIALLALLLGASLGLVFPWILQNLVDSVFNRGSFAELNRITLLLIFTFLLRAVTTYFQTYHLTYTGERIVTDLRKQTYEHLHALGLRF